MAPLSSRTYNACCASAAGVKVKSNPSRVINADFITKPQNNIATSANHWPTHARKQRKYSAPAIASIGPKGTCAPKASGAASPSGVSDGGATGDALPEIFCQAHARANHTVPTSAPPNTENAAPCQPQNAPIAPTNFTSPNPIASFLRIASATSAIQRTRPEPISRPWIDAV